MTKTGIPHRYTDEERAFLREYGPGHSHKEIAAEFCRRFPPGITTDQVKGYIKNNHLSTGRSGRFPKGAIPPNKGKKLPPDLYEKARGTMFKPGQMPHNTYPIGTEVVLTDGYIWVKVNDIPKAKKNVNWRQKHRLVWEQNYGEIPAGYYTIFKDGNKENFDLGNLACISKAENARLNQAHLRDDGVTDTGILIAKLMTAAGSAKEKVRRKHSKETR